MLDILNQLKIPKEKNVTDLKKSSSYRLGGGRISFIQTDTNELEILKILLGIYCSNWPKNMKGF